MLWCQAQHAQIASFGIRWRWLGSLGLALLMSACGSRSTLEVEVDEGPPGDSYRITTGGAERIDLLFMIDNSISMGDKQWVLAQAVPRLIDRLVDPICVDQTTRQPTGDDQSSDGCSSGVPELSAAQDIHIGVVTSSLGGHGGELCTQEHGDIYWNETQNDRGRLIARTSRWGEAPVPYDSNSFLVWDPSGTTHAPPGENDAHDLIVNFQNLIDGVGEQGCGFEAPLEAWYRFLIDPEPPRDVVFCDDAKAAQGICTRVGLAEAVGVDDVLLEQRAQFLRPDSLLAIVMLSDENDCSVEDGGIGDLSGIGYLVGDVREGAMPRSTSVCDENPNDECCLSCIQANWPSRCGDPMADPKCQQAPVYGDIDPSLDRLCTRCWEQKRRFGLDLLYPTSRYVAGLTEHELMDRNGAPAANPLYSPSAVFPHLPPRLDSSQILLAGIIGVPWQDIATDESLADPEKLEFLTARQIAAAGIWDDILGDPAASPPVPPSDPFMLQSIEPRSGTNPRTGDSITRPQAGAGGNPINGHEYIIQNNCDLQYACIFPLANPKECIDVEPGVGCDCKVSNEVIDRPICEGTTQVYAKAYPGLRHLQVLKGYGDNSIVASICPKNTDLPAADPHYGYNPAMDALVDRVAAVTQRSCLPEQLPTDPETDELLCHVVEVTHPAHAPACADHIPGRRPPHADTAELTRAHLQDQGVCGGAGNPCEGLSLCEITAVLQGADRDSCLNDADADVRATGYCYIDPLRTDESGAPVSNPGNPELVADCPPNEQRRVRIVAAPGTEPELPWPGALMFVVCP